MSRAAEAPLPAEGFAELIRDLSVSFGLDLSAVALLSVSRFLAELDVWRRRTNLTGALSARDLVSHALESALADELITHGERVIDIGSGAGLPGIVLASARPDLTLTLVEPREKRAAFLRHVVRALGLRNAAVVEDRIQNVGVQTFGVATTRAVGRFSTWVGEAGFLRAEGTLLAWTTKAVEAAAELPRFRLERTLAVPGAARRVIAVYRKSD
jgi:16S rRNA (guanine527-N7)-methyltransferase